MNRFAICVTSVIALSAAGRPGPNFSPARFRDGGTPAIPVAALAGGEVFVEIHVDASGRVTGAVPLRVTPPFTASVIAAVKDWRFVPAEEAVIPDFGAPRERRARVASSVLVAAVFRPPTLVGPTLGDLPKDVAAGSSAVPVPIATTAPGFPPMAIAGGTVLLEVRVDAAGVVSDVGVIQTCPPFDDPAIAAVREWRFRPAHRHGDAAESLAYVIFGFRAPIGESARPDPLSRRLSVDFLHEFPTRE